MGEEGIHSSHTSCFCYFSLWCVTFYIIGVSNQPAPMEASRWPVWFSRAESKEKGYIWFCLSSPPSRNSCEPHSHHGEAGAGPLQAVQAGDREGRPGGSYQQEDLEGDHQRSQPAHIHHQRSFHSPHPVGVSLWLVERPADCLRNNMDYVTVQHVIIWNKKNGSWLENVLFWNYWLKVALRC